MTVEMLKPVVMSSFQRFGQHNVGRHAAALTFYLLLVLSPVLVLFVVTAGIFLGDDQVRMNLLAQAEDAMGEAQAAFLATLIEGSQELGTGIIATIISIGVILFAASMLFEQLRLSINELWEIDPGQTSIKDLIVRRLVAVVIVLVVGLVLVAWMILDARISFLSGTVGVLDGFPIWQLVSFVVSWAFWSGVFAVAFKLLPRKKLEWRDVWFAAILTALAFAVLRYLLAIYFSFSAVSVAYGPAGAMVIILLWAFYSFQILLFGVEVSRAYAEQNGSLYEGRRKGKSSEASSGGSAAQPSR
jgi:membrane protein